MIGSFGMPNPFVNMYNILNKHQNRGTGDSGVSGLGPTSDILDPILLPQLKV